MYDFVDMNRWFFASLILVFVLAFPQKTHAIPPPDVITNIGSLFTQIFGLAVVFLSIGLSFILSYLKKGKVFAKQRPATALVAAISVILVTLCIAYVVTEIRRAQEQEEYDREVTEMLRKEIDTHSTKNGEVIESASTFFEDRKDLPLTITNEEFLAIDNAFVLDAREDEEYEYGFYPGSTHVRFADILDGKWSTLPTNKVVYVMCWSGIRGSEVASYLREKGIVAQALEEGASGWVEDGGAWEGEILFLNVYTEERYTKLFSTSEIRALQEDGVVLIDTRKPDGNSQNIPGSIFVSAFYTPTSELDPLLAQVPPGSRVITICDNFVNCFDAKIVGVKLEKRGNTFLGRYASPWEY